MSRLALTAALAGAIALLPLPLAAQQTAPTTRAPAVPAPQQRSMPEPRARGYDPTMRMLMDDNSVQGQQELYARATDFGRCVARSGERSIARLLAQPPGSRGERRAAQRIVRNNRHCAGRASAYDTPLRLLRGALAEGWLAGMREASPGTTQVVDTDRALAFGTRAAVREADPAATQSIFQTRADCQTMLATGFARQVIDAQVGSHSAIAAQRTLDEATPACGAAAEENALVTLVERSFLAEAMYHWLRSAGTGKVAALDLGTSG